jgi:glucarate dehydratase
VVVSTGDHEGLAIMTHHRRDWFRLSALGLMAGPRAIAGPNQAPLKITGLKVTPIALPDPPLLNASGCHGPYFLRNVIELETDGGILGLGETVGGTSTTNALLKAQSLIVSKNVFAYRAFARELLSISAGCYAGIELACLDACGKATGRRVCELVGGPVRESVEFAAYLFFRYGADNPVVLADLHRVGPRKGIDAWGEVRTPEAMAEMAAHFRDRWGFRVFKLKGGVLPPDVELDAMKAMAAKLGPDALLRIDPNGRWKTATAIRIGKAMAGLNLEYYEDPVRGQPAMADVRQATGLKMSTNMCVTRFADLPDAFRLKPIDVLLADHHYFGGFAGCQALGPICETAGWTMSQHSNNHAGITMAAMIHLAASIPQLTMASDTHYPWLIDGIDIIEGPRLAIEQGRMRVPAGPGLGVGLDRDRLAQAHETFTRSGMTGRDDANLMRRLEPGWTSHLF